MGTRHHNSALKCGRDSEGLGPGRASSAVHLACCSSSSSSSVAPTSEPMTTPEQTWWVAFEPHVTRQRTSNKTHSSLTKSRAEITFGAVLRSHRAIQLAQRLFQVWRRYSEKGRRNDVSSEFEPFSPTKQGSETSDTNLSPDFAT